MPDSVLVSTLLKQIPSAAFLNTQENRTVIKHLYSL